MKSGGHNTKFLVHSITCCHMPDKEAASKTIHEKSRKTSTQDGIQASSGESAAAAVCNDSVFRSSVISDINLLKTNVSDLRRDVHQLRIDSQKPVYYYVRLNIYDLSTIGTSLLESVLSCHIQRYLKPSKACFEGGNLRVTPTCSTHIWKPKWSPYLCMAQVHTLQF